MSGWPPGGEAYEVEPVAGQMPASVILPGLSGPDPERDREEYDDDRDGKDMDPHYYDGADDDD